MKEEYRLWEEFKKSGAPRDYLLYAEAKRSANAERLKETPPADRSVDGVTELS